MERRLALECFIHALVVSLALTTLHRQYSSNLLGLFSDTMLGNAVIEQVSFLM